MSKEDEIKNYNCKKKEYDYNLKKKLILEKKINKDFIEKIKFLKLEEIITLKLLTSTEQVGGKLFNFPFLKFASDICKESVIKYAISIAKNKREASLILGMKKADFIHYLKYYNLEEEFHNVGNRE
tara:strand:+ start:1055 stop:1432 length:378 start_codon:yes stop_codon:yes gene_type:complete